MTHPVISFFLPPGDVPPFVELPSGSEMTQYPGRFLSPSLNWTWRTFHHLDEAGFPCRLVTSLPEEGMIFCTANNLPLLFRPGPRQFIICCVADSPPRFFTPCHVFQSASQAGISSAHGRFPVRAHMPHWPQPGLIPRAPSRRQEFRHVDYFGAADQLAPELQSAQFAERLNELGLLLRLHFQHYHDYHDTDVVLAVRTLDARPVGHKPASKLINAWRAGVPAVLGSENAFRELRSSSLDYLEAMSADDCLAALKRLRDDSDLRRQMVENGARRAEEFSLSALTSRWRTLLEDTLPSCYEQWCSQSASARTLFFVQQAARRVGISLVRRGRRRLGLAGHNSPP